MALSSDERSTGPGYLPGQQCDFILFGGHFPFQLRYEGGGTRKFYLRLLVRGFGGQAPLETYLGLPYPLCRVASVRRTMASSLSRAASS